ncbi:helix-turn-helix domain-containing protein [Leptolyngbya sp. AN03gr2]|uniref:helix-turn-helix domain-containing protein n=1 Tax=unclassified Leptolyngbya TaxID=2650499 RepID=UPI003D316704
MPRKSTKRTTETDTHANQVTPAKPKVTPTQPADSKPVKQPRKRSRTVPRPATSSDLFPGESIHRMASSRLIWEGANILTQRKDLQWADSEDGLCYESLIAKGKGFLSFWLTQDLFSKYPSVLESEAALALIEQFDIRAACMHLIYSAHATQLDRPWEQQFVLNDRQLERYLGLDKNKNLNRQEKLQLMLELAKQPCHLLVYVSYPDQGRIQSFTVSRTWLWEIAEPMLHFQECLQDESGDHVGEQMLVGFTLSIRCGNWAKYFLNEEMRRNREGYYEYGILSQQILQDLMSTWHHYEGAARLMTWLLFKTKINRHSPMTVEALMKVAFGEKTLQLAKSNYRDRAKVVRSWLTSLKVLIEKGWKITRDVETYPIQYWIDTSESGLLAQIPDDPEQAAAFWAKDATQEAGARLTDKTKRMRGQFDQLLASKVWIQPPEVVAEKLDEIDEARRLYSKVEPKRRALNVASSDAPQSSIEKPPLLAIESGMQLKQLRLAKGMTQVELADAMERTESWVKMIEAGKRKIQPKYQEKLIRLLS